MAETDLMQLYSRRILALTTAIPHQGRLDDAQASVQRRSPQCGSSVTVHLSMADGRISDFAQEVRACALGQASASVLGQAVIGMDRAGIVQARDQLRAMLTQDAPAPDAPFSDLEALTPARAYPNRHPSILLAWDATLEALDKASV
ncbi:MULTISPECIES: iron-sulfur cluster assembly scaffold protein [Paracoccus]|jgi:NifU-like protein involved in Fe-S cluster formation|uniref:Iron-sulfur cluster assembly scaffold protein n=1 Tax=Paracoccus haeundaensis TaxID=225362 RepID=A0A5C4R442_9RHOB|nr:MULTISPECIES: iron-sulfur cluster assembly scaffold protein [Paracoccus]KIX18499.1 nitrogen fixation protein NifU [Paracoccus sp. 228]TNH38477.1 iron-sulfur cluster assembly scaffold protein [Paracoccus haeundaensis]